MMKLTAKQIANLETIGMARKANRDTLEIAINFHANRSQELSTMEENLWKELREVYGFSACERHHISSVDGIWQVTEGHIDD